MNYRQQLKNWKKRRIEVYKSYKSGQSMAEIGREMGITRQAVRRLISKERVTDAL